MKASHNLTIMSENVLGPMTPFRPQLQKEKVCLEVLGIVHH